MKNELSAASVFILLAAADLLILRLTLFAGGGEAANFTIIALLAAEIISGAGFLLIAWMFLRRVYRRLRSQGPVYVALRPAQSRRFRSA